MAPIPVPKNLKPPHKWDVYKNPIHNLLYGVLVQAVLDNAGYMDTSHMFRDGADARDFLESDGLLILNYLHKEGEKL